MRLAKASAALLLNLVALGAIPSVAHAASTASSSTIIIKIEDSTNAGDPSSVGVTPVVVPPVIIKPDESDEEDGTGTWSPPDGQTQPHRQHLDPLGVVLPFANNPGGAEVLNPGPFENSSRPQPGSQHLTKPFLVSAVSPLERPTNPNAQVLPGAPITDFASPHQINPDQNQAISINRIVFGAESPMQDFINQATIVLVMLGLLSIGLVSVVLRNGRVSKIFSRR